MNLAKHRRILLATVATAGLAAPSLAAGDMGAFAVEEAAALGADHARQHAQLEGAAADRTASRIQVAATSTAGAVAGSQADVGAWSSPVPIPVTAIHTAVLPTGKVLLFSTPVNPNNRYNPDPASAPNAAFAAVWDPATGVSRRVDPPVDPATGLPTNIWCAGLSHTADGSVLVTGGNLAFSSSSSDFKGLNTLFTFDPFAERWVRHPTMRHGRWYPSQLLLPDGQSLITSGLDETGGGFSRNLDIELFTPRRDRAAPGTVSVLGTRTTTGAGAPGQPPNGGYYPHLFLLPSGKALTAGPFPEDTWALPRPAVSTNWENIPNLGYDRLWGTGVIVPQATPGSTRVMLIGGSAPPTITSTTTDIAKPTTEVYDESRPSDGWQPAPPLNVGRGHHNTVLLPDGSMVTVGGGVGIRNGDQWQADPAQRQVELWDPDAGTWRLGPAQAEARAYHSTAVLLPDGRVLSAGDDANGGIDRDTAEIYSPPYLFRGPRPQISWAPSQIRYGATFSVASADVDVERAVFMAPGAATHAVDTSQRHVPVSITRRADGRGYDLTAPAGGTIAPPGYYMLFLVNRAGVPSVAAWIRLGADAPDPPPIPARPAAGAAAPPSWRPVSFPVGSRLLLGSFEGKRLAPWRGRGGVARVRGGTHGRHSLRLTGVPPRPASAWREIRGLPPGRYRLTFQLQGARPRGVIRAPSVTEIRLTPRRGPWRSFATVVRLTGAKVHTVRVRLGARWAARLDNVRIARLS